MGGAGGGPGGGCGSFGAERSDDPHLGQNAKFGESRGAEHAGQVGGAWLGRLDPH